MYLIDEHAACAVAGITADANILINQVRLHAQRYWYNYQEPQPVEQLVQRLCDEKQAYTQYGGLRPFGVSMLYAGWDAIHGFQLYQSDPSGNYNGWKVGSLIRTWMLTRVPTRILILMLALMPTLMITLILITPMLTRIPTLIITVVITLIITVVITLTIT